MASADRTYLVRVAGCACALALAVSVAACGAPSPHVVADGCPAVMPGTSNANEDFADMVVWEGRTYISAETVSPPGGPSSDPVRLGSKVGEVTCSLVDGPLSGVTERLANLPWPDGTATALSQGATIYAVRGESTECVLAARRDGSLNRYAAIDTEDNTWPLLCER